MNKAQQACELFLAGFALITTALAVTTQQITKLGPLGTERQLEILNFNIVVTQTRSDCPEVNDTSTDVDGFQGSWSSEYTYLQFDPGSLFFPLPLGCGSLRPCCSPGVSGWTAEPFPWYFRD